MPPLRTVRPIGRDRAIEAQDAAVDATASRISRHVRQGFESVERTWRKLPIRALLASRDLDPILGGGTWASVVGAVEGSEEALAAAFEAGARSAPLGGRTDPTAWASARAPALGTEILGTTRQAIADSVARHLSGTSPLVRDRVLTPERRAALTLLDADGVPRVGLHTRALAAWDKLADRIISAGLSVGAPLRSLRRRLDAIFRTARSRRLRDIGENEAATAVSAGVEAAWAAGLRGGTLDQDRYVQDWVTRLSGVCPLCVRLDSVYAKAGEPFRSPDGWVGIPPRHPRCRCTRRLVPRFVAGFDRLTIQPPPFTPASAKKKPKGKAPSA